MFCRFHINDLESLFYILFFFFPYKVVNCSVNELQYRTMALLTHYARSKNSALLINAYCVKGNDMSKQFAYKATIITKGYV